MVAPTWVAGQQQILGQLGAFMAAVRTVESGSPQGNYTVTNALGCRGAYQFCPGTSMYNSAQAQGWTRSAQDSIAASTMEAYFSKYGSWYQVAQAWNGGPGAVGGSQTAGYANRVTGLQQQYGNQFPVPSDAKIPGALGGSNIPTPPATASGSCHTFSPGLHLGPVGESFCMDKPIAILAIGAGGLLVLTGLVLLFVGGLKETGAGRSAARAASTVGGPVGYAAGRVSANSQAKAQARQKAQDDAEVAELLENSRQEQARNESFHRENTKPRVVKGAGRRARPSTRGKSGRAAARAS